MSIGFWINIDLNHSLWHMKKILKLMFKNNEVVNGTTEPFLNPSIGLNGPERLLCSQTGNLFEQWHGEDTAIERDCWKNWDVPAM